jgi:hypothetical protein
VVPTPLSRLSFWRLVLDEAQLAGSATKAAEMAKHIRARHRWAVTGECTGVATFVLGSSLDQTADITSLCNPSTAVATMQRLLLCGCLSYHGLDDFLALPVWHMGGQVTDFLRVCTCVLLSQAPLSPMEGVLTWWDCSSSCRCLTSLKVSSNQQGWFLLVSYPKYTGFALD